jgi:serine/threonine-protein kinase
LFVQPVSDGSKARKFSTEYSEIGRFSPDGSLLSVFVPGEGGSLGLGVVPTRGEARIHRLVDSHVSKNTYTAPFSPDGKWLGYISNESGRDELYVVSSSGSGGKWQISPNGVVWAAWPWHSKEIFFVQPDARLFAVEFNVRDGNVVIGTPRLMFGGKPIPFCVGLDITSDGKRILAALPAGETGSLTLVTNWMSRLAENRAAE